MEKKAGVTNSHIRNIEEGIRKPTFEVLMKLLNALNVEASEFLMETGNMKPIKQWGNVKRVPVISWVQAGAWKEAYNPETYSEFVETATKGEFALRVEGDGMEPEFHKGDIIDKNNYHGEPRCAHSTSRRKRNSIIPIARSNQVTLNPQRGETPVIN